MTESWLPAPVALGRLRVRAQTLYAYVSRGLVEARPDPDDPRKSLYRATDIDGLSRRKARATKLRESRTPYKSSVVSIFFIKVIKSVRTAGRWSMGAFMGGFSVNIS